MSVMIVSNYTCLQPSAYERSSCHGAKKFGCYVQADKRIADMKLAKDFAATIEEFRKLQNLAIQREMAYKAVVPQNAQPK